MKLTPLGKIIKDHRKRCCPLCSGVCFKKVLTSQGKNRKKITVTSRSFDCKDCKAEFFYTRAGSNFEIYLFIYRLDNLIISCRYEKDEEGYTINRGHLPKAVFYETYETVSKSNVVIPFPPSKKYLDNKLQTLITFL